MLNKVKEILVVFILFLICAILILNTVTHINNYQTSILQKEAAKASKESAVYMQETEMIKHEDYVLYSNLERIRLREWLIKNGIKESEVDKFIEENSK